MKKLALRFLCIILIVSMILSILPSVFAASFPFADVSTNHIYYEAIKYVYDHNIMLGVTPTTFCPYTKLTRGMAVTVLYRMSRSTLQQAPIGFTDVPYSAYYYFPVGWAQYHGIVNGTSPTTFEPDALLTKQQFLTMLYRYATEYEGYTFSLISSYYVNALADYSSVSPYAREAVNWALNCGILSESISYCYPNSSVNRGLTANYVYILLTTVLGDGKSLAIRSCSQSTTNEIHYSMEYMGYDTVCVGYDLTPRAMNFALRNSEILYLHSRGATNYILLVDGKLYSTDIGYNSLHNLDLAYISASYAGLNFANALYNTGKAESVVAFEGAISASTDTNGIHYYNQRVFRYLRLCYSIANSTAHAEYDLYHNYGALYGADTVVIYGEYDFTT